ncbi:MAG TPA: prolyl oligopeptidase family serine peptidase [Pseudonocardiaceae bacterium]|nr:prolyl oligopeptidase family serine peptidase [Pseudonocardiaceae bacterium]
MIKHDRDGLPLRGHVTFPPGVPRKALPCVLAVHAEPWSRDVPGFRQSVQWLTNRGYVCRRVNFRGSTGYGKSFVDAGNGEWGGGMQTDLFDTVDFAVEQGWVDPARTAVYGQVLRGYAALMAATVKPAHWRPLLDLMYRRIGGPATDSDRLREQSPCREPRRSRSRCCSVMAATIHACRSENFSSSFRHSTSTTSTMIVVFADEGHDVSRHANVMRFAEAMGNFHARHLGGRAEPPSEKPLCRGTVSC